MKLKTIPYIVLTAALALSALHGQALFSTDRLGYNGTVTQYETLSDLNADTGGTVINIDDRDAAIYVDDSTWAVVMGSWWYSADPSGNQGFGNTNGNTGIGFMQIFDDDYSSVDSFEMYFDGFDGTYWTEAILSLTGSNAGSSESARFSTHGNKVDAGQYFDYELNLAVGGLQGSPISGGLIEANNHPTSVVGNFSGTFWNTGDGDYTSESYYEDYFKIDLDFTMTNWAWQQQQAGTLTYPGTGEIYPSQFIANPIPEPSTVGLLSLAGLGAFLIWRRKRKS